jgi:molecular chaperone GrpE
MTRENEPDKNDTEPKAPGGETLPPELLPDDIPTKESVAPIEDLLEQSGEASEQRTRVVTDDELKAAQEMAEAVSATTTDEIERLYTAKEVRERLDQAHTQFEQRYLRLMAEFENFRKRTARERELWAAEAVSAFAADLLGVLDSFDHAREKSAGAPAPYVEGIDVTAKQLRSTLRKHGIECVDPLGEPFDPRFHEAFSQVPSGEHEPGTVAVVVEKGYTIEGRLLRAARVVVAAEQPSDAAKQEGAA